MNLLSFLLFIGVLMFSVKGLVMPESGSIDFQTKRWTDFKRAARGLDYALPYNSEYTRRQLYEHRPSFNDLLI
uniref:Uncharacterized protein n=1 Tax=Trichobilharzia regenti TaxID=157069 RepID=A0AA85JWM3_TRIRE|nr:unnamed protein product [Trichobilharzia regenti]